MFNEKTQLKIAAPSPFNSVMHMHNTNPCVTRQCCLLLQLQPTNNESTNPKKKWPHYKQNNCVHVFYHGLFLLEFWKPCTPETEIQNSALFHCLQGGTERITHQEDLIGTFTECRVIRAVHWSLAGELGVELAGVISRLLPKEAGLFISSED